MIRALIFEAIGTSLLVFANLMTDRKDFQNSISGDHSFAKGLVDLFVFAGLYYVGHRVSGCHLNPAVSFAMAFTPKFSLLEVS
jgi:glycerol uptake facilitator-like aquaporin